ncbi:hypothetical protein [Aquirhabdus parva]|uniref:Lipoprotein n=1 Tax=Aquirhabdus parva TaxID=2283318 RepID=A0A345P738_9GAMM|nr:hypothetical protein [Aquirhabdus parva]AXI03097.1 hypothetical protein HYN46_09740 [Aquirhabdus parva]
MKNLALTTPIALILASSILLVGCSRAPSESDIKTAYTNEVEQTNALTRKFGGDSMTIKVNGLKKLDCKASSNKGQFICQVEIDTTLPIIGVHHQNTQLTLAQGDTGNGQGWVIVRGVDAAP